MVIRFVFGLIWAYGCNLDFAVTLEAWVLRLVLGLELKLKPIVWVVTYETGINCFPTMLGCGLWSWEVRFGRP